jgi:hypothetical protein
MLNYLCANKTAYRKGQIFPFMLAIVAVLLIMFLITFNLGQMAFFKTDTSNAADAGALAGSSVISGALLGLGLQNDAMAAEAYVTMVAAILFIVCIYSIPLAIAVLVLHVSRSILAYIQQWNESIKALGLARKNALQYAWQNVGVDQPRPSLATFIHSAFFYTHLMPNGNPFNKAGLFASCLVSVVPGGPGIPGIQNCTGQSMIDDCINSRNGCTPPDLGKFQHIYENGYDDTLAGDDTYQKSIARALRSDFSGFMGDDGSGWWQYGTPGIDNIPPGVIISAYAWNDDANKPGPGPSYGAGTCSGLKDNPGIADDLMSVSGYNYDNVVKIEVSGPVTYEFYMMQAPPTTDPLSGILKDFIKEELGKYIAWIFFFVDYFLDWFTSWMGKMVSDLIVGFPVAIIPDGEDNSSSSVTSDNSDELTRNPMQVKVTRYKRPADLGMWRMAYGGGASGIVWSQSQATLTRNFFKDIDADVRGPTCASVFPAMCYKCGDDGIRKLNDPLSNLLEGLLKDLLHGDSVTDAFKAAFENTSDRHLFESEITKVDTNRE